jgi:malonate transporter
MIGVLIGFAIIGVIVGTGYLVGRGGLLGPHAEVPLSRLAFFVLTPPLVFTVLADADLAHLFSTQLPIAAIAAATCFALFALIGAIRRRSVADTTIGALGSGYVNGNNIGLPVSAYVLGDASASIPVVLLQLLVFAPIALTILDFATHGRPSVSRVLLQPVRNPLIVASLLGVAVAVSGVEIPAAVMEPFRLVAAAAIPVILLNFGMSLHGRRVLAAESPRSDILIVTAIKVVVMPLVAWLVASLIFGLDGQALFAAVALAALPAAQNVFNYAQRYQVAQTLARDVVLLTSAFSVPALFIVAALLAPV